MTSALPSLNSSLIFILVKKTKDFFSQDPSLYRDLTCEKIVIICQPNYFFLFLSFSFFFLFSCQNKFTYFVTFMIKSRSLKSKQNFDMHNWSLYQVW